MRLWAQLCGELGKAHGLGIDFTADGVPVAIPRDTALCLYRITQEALRNVIKHSGARHARVELRGSPDAVWLRVADDGSGFDPESATGTGGLGLISMRERLRLVGGEIAVDSRPSGGARIEVRTPLEAGRYHAGLSAPRDLENTLLIALSNSGAAARVAEAAGLYRARCTLTLAVTKNADSRLAHAANKTLLLPMPAFPSAPGFGPYAIAFVALLGPGLHF